MLARMWRKGNPSALLVRMQICAATVENSMMLPQKIKHATALWSQDLTSRNLLKETQNTNSKDYMHRYVHCRIIYNNQDFEVAHICISRWGDKTALVHLHNRILLSHKKEEKFSFATAWMDLQNIMLNKISQEVRDKYHMISALTGT